MMRSALRLVLLSVAVILSVATSAPPTFELWGVSVEPGETAVALNTPLFLDLSDPDDVKPTLALRRADGVAVAGTASRDQYDQRLTFTPVAPLLPDTDYELVLVGGGAIALPSYGPGAPFIERVGDDVVVRFSTRSAPALREQAQGTGTAPSVTLGFTEALDQDTLTKETVRAFGTDGVALEVLLFYRDDDRHQLEIVTSTPAERIVIDGALAATGVALPRTEVLP